MPWQLPMLRLYAATNITVCKNIDSCCCLCAATDSCLIVNFFVALSHPVAFTAPQQMARLIVASCWSPFSAVTVSPPGDFHCCCHWAAADSRLIVAISVDFCPLNISLLLQTGCTATTVAKVALSALQQTDSWLLPLLSDDFPLTVVLFKSNR